MIDHLMWKFISHIYNWPLKVEVHSRYMVQLQVQPNRRSRSLLTASDSRWRVVYVNSWSFSWSGRFSIWSVTQVRHRRRWRMKIIKTEFRTCLQSSTMTNICASSWIRQVLVILIQLMRSISGIETVRLSFVADSACRLGRWYEYRWVACSCVLKSTAGSALNSSCVGKVWFVIKDNIRMVLVTLVILYFTLMWYFQNILNLVRTPRILLQHDHQIFTAGWSPDFHGWWSCSPLPQHVNC